MMHTEPADLYRNYDRLFIIGNGTDQSSLSNAFEVSYNGHSIVYHTNGSGGATPNGGLPAPDVTKGVIKGATYTDNVIYAWGSVVPTAVAPFVSVTSDFGVAHVVPMAVGTWQVTLNPVDPYTGNTINLTAGSVVATLTKNDGNPTCAFIFTSDLGYPAANQFVVRIRGLSCEGVDLPFTFHVTARP